MASPKEIRAVQDHFGLNEASAVEKDLQVTLALRAVASTNANPFRLVFGGGTCLARAYKLVPRMSEDADLKVVAKDAAGLSGSQRRRLLGELRERVTASLQAGGFAFDPANSAQVHSRDGNRSTLYRVPYEQSSRRAVLAANCGRSFKSS